MNGHIFDIGQMNVKPGDIYRSFTFTVYDDMIQWTIYGPLSGDLVAGLLVGVNILLDDLRANHEYGRHYNHTVQLIRDDNMSTEIDLTTLGMYEYALLEYIWDIEDQEDGPEETTYYRAGYFIWRLKDFNFIYDSLLYTFRTPEFIQGFISMCNGFGVDFRQYVLGLPSKYERETDTITYYSIEGYDLPLLTLEQEEEYEY